LSPELHETRTIMNNLQDYQMFAWIERRITVLRQEWMQNEAFDWRSTLAIVVGAIVLTPLFIQFPNLGWDWYYFHIGTWNFSYPPWMPVVLAPLLVRDWRLGLAILTCVLFVTTAVAAAREAKSFGRSSMLNAALLAICTGPVWMLTWQGNVVPVTLFGLIALPFGVPLATVQPHLASWALLARRKWMIWGIGFLIMTFIVWGWWPSRYYDLSRVLSHPIAMGWGNLGWPLLVVGLVLLVFSNADPLRLIAVGTFITPYLMPVHMLLLTPAIGRVRGWRRVVIWAGAQLTLIPVMFVTIESKYVAMLFPLLVWWVLRPRETAAVQVTTTPTVRNIQESAL
jgi:hypothetical protein